MYERASSYPQLVLKAPWNIAGPALAHRARLWKVPKPWEPVSFLSLSSNAQERSTHHHELKLGQILFIYPRVSRSPFFLKKKNAAFGGFCRDMSEWAAVSVQELIRLFIFCVIHWVIQWKVTFPTPIKIFNMKLKLSRIRQKVELNSKRDNPGPRWTAHATPSSSTHRPTSFKSPQTSYSAQPSWIKGNGCIRVQHGKVKS